MRALTLLLVVAVLIPGPMGAFPLLAEGSGTQKPLRVFVDGSEWGLVVGVVLVDDGAVYFVNAGQLRLTADQNGDGRIDASEIGSLRMQYDDAYVAFVDSGEERSADGSETTYHLSNGHITICPLVNGNTVLAMPLVENDGPPTLFADLNGSLANRIVLATDRPMGFLED